MKLVVVMKAMVVYIPGVDGEAGDSSGGNGDYGRCTYSDGETNSGSLMVVIVMVLTVIGVTMVLAVVIRIVVL